MLSHFSCVQLCDPVDCSLPGSSVHGISQARILEWVAVSFLRAAFRPRDRTRVSYVYLPWQVGSYCSCSKFSSLHAGHLMQIPPRHPSPCPKGKKTLFTCDENFRICPLSIFQIHHIAVLTRHHAAHYVPGTHNWKSVSFDSLHSVPLLPQ